MNVKKFTEATTEIRFNRNKEKKEKWFLLTSDWHWDNPKCDRKKLRKDLDRAVELDAGILVFGDLFCAMQGKYDKRSHKSDLRPEHQKGNYLDKLVDTAAQWLEPYKDNLALISYGNHETSILNRHETDLIQRLTDKLQDKGSKVVKGAYSGYIKLVSQRDDKSQVRAKTLFFHHGHGGGGPVTKGVIQTNRRSIYTPDADFIVSGHVHERWMIDLMRERLKQSGDVVIDYQRHICLPTYKEEYLQHKGWHVERGAPPKPIGGCWMKLTVEGRKKQMKADLIWT